MSDSRIISRNFDYIAAKTIEEALELLSKHVNSAKVIAGGTNLLVDMKIGGVETGCLIDITHIDEIRVLRATENGVSIGAGVNFHQIETSPLLRPYEALYEAAQSVSRIQIKNMGTIGGNLCNGSPASDSVPALMVFDATLKTKKKNGERNILIEEYFVGPGTTVLSEDEILIEIELPPVSVGSGSAFAKIARVSADLAKINAAVYLERKGDVCKECRIAFGSVAPTPFRAKQAESILRGEKFSERIMEMVTKKASEEISPITDVRSTKEYRVEMSKVMTKRLLTKAWERAEG